MSLEEKLIKQYNELTDENDHTGAVLALANALPNLENEVRDLLAIKDAHETRGYMEASDRFNRLNIERQVIRAGRAFFQNPNFPFETKNAR
jgi:hypothetical protein